MTTFPEVHHRPVSAAWFAAARSLMAAVLAAGVSGLLVGGVLGRLGMRLLALTSPEIAQGRLTDDAARVGQFTLGGSVTLAIALAVGSALVVGPAYLLARRALPPSRLGRVAGFALLTGAIGGALFVHDHPSFDYSILEPVWLAIAIFILVPALAGAGTAFLTEVLAPPPRPALPVPWQAWWRSRPVTILGYAVYWGLVTWGAYNIVVDVVSVVTDRASGAPFTL